MSTVTPLHPLLQPTPRDVIHEAASAWKRHGASTRHSAYLTPWTLESAADGSPLVTCRVTGLRAELAMRDFANGLDPVGSVDQRPRLDYSEPGVVACSWRRGDVWVRLWAADTATAPVPTPLVIPDRVAPLPSGRLPYRRNTACGTTPDYNEEN